MCQADSGKIFPVDLFFIANIQRSQFVIQGFLMLIKEKNFFAAAPLIRLHLDNLVHIYAVFIHPNPHELTTNLNRGKKRLEDYRDKNGKRLTNSNVLKKFFTDTENKEFLPLRDIYDETSKFIHFSEKHMQSMFTTETKDSTKTKISILAKEFPISQTEEDLAIQAMVMITRAQIKYLIGWTATKNGK